MTIVVLKHNASSLKPSEETIGTDQYFAKSFCLLIILYLAIVNMTPTSEFNLNIEVLTCGIEPQLQYEFYDVTK